ncbi:unnamed protein product [Allacma fusca]|uniref:Uncharacterized protein n=1 Tax=Allacma fusca TaxID=39272 RepID=A0A8J2LTX4_9HEXA|nr:unnamed protein product [Allacma fusca]
MCCFLALRKVLLFGAFIHMFLGLLFIYYLVALITTLVSVKKYIYMGFLFMTYYCLFLPLGLVIFWGTYKRSRFLLRWSAGIFLLLQIYGITIQSAFSFSIHSWAPAVSTDLKFDKDVLTKLITQSFLAISYLFTIFFYLRELEPEEEPYMTNRRQVAYHPTQQQPIPIPNIQSHHDFMMKC